MLFVASGFWILSLCGCFRLTSHQELKFASYKLESLSEFIVHCISMNQVKEMS